MNVKAGIARTPCQDVRYLDESSSPQEGDFQETHTSGKENKKSHLGERESRETIGLEKRARKWKRRYE